MAVIFSVHLYAQRTDFACTDFRNADNVAARYSKHPLNDLKSLADKLTRSLPSEEEKFRAIYVWVANNIEYDYALYLKNKQKRESLKKPEDLAAWNKGFSLRVFKNLLEKQKTVCSGYAYLVRELATYAGLTCVIIDGYGRNAHSNIGGPGIANHSWNAVRLHNKWYLCDATWSSGAYDTEQSKYVKKFDVSYFLADPLSFVNNHYPLDSSWMLLAYKPTLDQFLNGPLVYSGALLHEVHAMSPRTLNLVAAKGETISFQFAKNGDEIVKSLQLTIEGPNTKQTFDTRYRNDSSGGYSVDHTFHTKGTQTVHFLLNERYIFTYVVTVR
ncbi:transglutaminase domain-containing protein [Chryseolinea serpens]|nr:transglutaminase domain-containing protein [Chryseolinea serpens]